MRYVCDGTKQISFYFYNIGLILNDIERGPLLFHVRDVINSDNCSMDIPLHIEHVCASCHCYFFLRLYHRFGEMIFLFYITAPERVTDCIVNLS